MTGPYRHKRIRFTLLLLAMLSLAALQACAARARQKPEPEPEAPPKRSVTLVCAPTPQSPTCELPAMKDPNHPGHQLQGGEILVETARSQFGKKYRYGSCSPSAGFDCSGLVLWTFQQNGIELPRSSREQFEVGNPVGINHLNPGDLIFFRIRRRNQYMHVGIVSGPGTFIHSPNRGDRVKEESYFDSYWISRYIGARRIVR